MFSGRRFIRLGSRVHIRRGARIEAVTEYNGIKYQPVFMFGDRVQVEYHSHFSGTGSLSIGARTLIARNVSIVTSHHRYEDPTVSVQDQNLNPADVIIGEDCFLGTGCVIMPGVSLGKHCIVGANSVVNRSASDFSVLAGVPARIIRQYDPTSEEWIRVSAEVSKNLN